MRLVARARRFLRLCWGMRELGQHAEVTIVEELWGPVGCYLPGRALFLGCRCGAVFYRDPGTARERHANV